MNDSDIDLFIITKKNRIWLTRFFCVLAIMFLGQRPTEKKVKNRICLSFFVTENKMNLEDLRMGGNGDVYFKYWIAGLVPVYNINNTYKSFIEKNIWIGEMMPNWTKEGGVGVLSGRKTNEKFHNCYENIIDVLFVWASPLAKKLQLKKMPYNLKEIMNKDTRVVVSDDTLKFFSKDRRESYNKKFSKSLEEVINLE